MIDELLSIIKDQVFAKNSYLNRISINCFQLESGEIVADFNRNEAYEGGSDIIGMGAYIRYTNRFEYSPINRSSENKQTSSNTKQHGISVPLRMVIYSFDNKEFNLTRLEEKISNDLMLIDFSTHNGNETQMSLELIDANTNPSEVWKSEMGRPVKDGQGFYQMISINFVLKFVRTAVKKDCFEDCYVFNNDEKC